LTGVVNITLKTFRLETSNNIEQGHLQEIVTFEKKRFGKYHVCGCSNDQKLQVQISIETF